VLDGTYKRRGRAAPGASSGGTESNGGSSLSPSPTASSRARRPGARNRRRRPAGRYHGDNLTHAPISTTAPSSCASAPRLRGPKGIQPGGHPAPRPPSTTSTPSTPLALYSSILSGIPATSSKRSSSRTSIVQHVGGAPADFEPNSRCRGRDQVSRAGHCSALTPSQGFFFRTIKNLEVSHAEIQPVAPTARVVLPIEDVQPGADFVAVTAPTARPAFSSTIPATCASASAAPRQTRPLRKAGACS